MQSYKRDFLISEGVQWRCVHVCTDIAAEELKGEQDLHNVLKGWVGIAPSNNNTCFSYCSRCNSTSFKINIYGTGLIKAILAGVLFKLYGCFSCYIILFIQLYKG